VLSGFNAVNNYPVTSDSYFPFSSIEEMKANTDWDLKVSLNVTVVPEPTAEEIQVLRSVDTTGMLKKK